MSKREDKKPRKHAHKGHTRTQGKVRIASRRVRVAELLLQGNTYRQMANELGVKSTKTIFDDVEAIIGDWRKEQKHNVDEWTALELSKIGKIETQAWAAWERSQEDEETVSKKTATVTIKTKTGRGSESLEVPALTNEETRTTRGQAGDPRFLTVVLKCVIKRCELLGLDKPKKLDLGNGKVIFLMPDNGRGDATRDASD